MDNKKISENEVSEQNKALQSETWKEARKVIETEIVHFTDMPEILDFEAVKVNKNDGAYGIMWGRLVRDYLGTAYSKEDVQAEIVSDGVAYKILKREKVTVFYDADGSTIFDVENKRLEKEYELVAGKGNVSEEKPENKTSDDVPAGKMIPADTASAKQKAKEKLEKEMKADKDKSFAEPVIGYLLKRCTEDEGLAQDVVQKHKTWKKCIDYIYEMAKKQAVGNRAAVRSDVVFEWAEDYYHKDDKAEEEKKEAERKAKKAKAAAERKAKAKEKPTKTSVPEKKEDKPREQPKPKKNSRDMDGQLDMFSMMGM